MCMVDLIHKLHRRFLRDFRRDAFDALHMHIGSLFAVPAKANINELTSTKSKTRLKVIRGKIGVHI